MSVLITIHALAAAILSLYALHQAILLVLYLRYRRQPGKQALPDINPAHRQPWGDTAHLPSITVQLPLYNERFVAERVVQACAALDYPAGKLNIQVLDDSTDDTVHIVQQAVDEAWANGVDIEIIRRRKRTGFKAGALAEATASVRGDLVAIFDADFIPAPDLFRRLIHEQNAFAHPRTGFVQTRWGHLNRDESRITRAQAMVLDIHFLVEQPARCNSDLFMAFNGSGGIWRRECIVDAGGWQYDTLVEDLDLSYRAQLHGWHGRFLENEAVPGELPGDILAYKLQQGRWARGTVQCVRKLMPRILSSPKTLTQKIFAWMHLTGYIIHPLMLVMMITTPILLLYSAELPAWLGLVGVLSLAPIASMIVAQRVQQRSFGKTLVDVLPAMLFGIGIAFSNTVGMITGLMSKQSNEWIRTPKAVDGAAAGATKHADLHASSYQIRGSWTMWVELALAVYGLVALGMDVVSGLLALGHSHTALRVRLHRRRPQPVCARVWPQASAPHVSRRRAQRVARAGAGARAGAVELISVRHHPNPIQTPAQ